MKSKATKNSQVENSATKTEQSVRAVMGDSLPLQEGCVRHPDRQGEFGFVSAYIYPNNWRDTMKGEQTWGPFCGECRSEFIEWTTHRPQSGASYNVDQEKNET